MSLNHREVVTLQPTLPAELSRAAESKCRVGIGLDSIEVGNGFLCVRVSLQSGVITAINNKLTGESHTIEGDRFGLQFGIGDRPCLQWENPGDTTLNLENREVTDSEVRLTMGTQQGDVRLRIHYLLRADWFWIERRVEITHAKGELRIERLVYGRCDIPGSTVRTLELGAFDRPRLLVSGENGVFAGIGWWFYQVSDDGSYQNADMRFDAGERFESEPWYVGILRTETGDPYPGWSWYRAFLHQRKRACDKLRCWSMWNAGWGQWGIDVDDPSAPECIAFAAGLGIREFLFGSGIMGKGVGETTRLIHETEVGRRVAAALKQHRLVGGALAQGNLDEGWADAAIMGNKYRELREFASLPDFRAFSFDFVGVADTFTAHWNMTGYFRTARKVLDYTECHLGMSKYGPQCQREVMVNHPDDVHEFDISHFSPDWATMLAFRHSRTQWQRKYDYLMPESGLYYFATHYANWGHPRRFTDPEPQQIFYGPHAYTGIGFNFHDHFGYRDAVMGAMLFSPYLIFGHLDTRMPERDVAFTRATLGWANENEDWLREARVCHEDEQSCVLSKLRDNAGLIALFNYGTGLRTFRLRMPADGPKALRLRRVYPTAAPAIVATSGTEQEVTVSGESLVLLEVNGSLRSDPPANDTIGTLDLPDWLRLPEGWQTTFIMPDIRRELESVRDPNLPNRLLALELLGEYPIRVALSLMEKENLEMLRPSDRPMPDIFRRLYGFEAGCVETGKLVPWAFANRIWLVYRPDIAPLIGAPCPRIIVNDAAVNMIPRVNYRTCAPEEWTCPVFFADLTPCLNFGAANTLTLRIQSDAPPSCTVRSAVRGSELLSSNPTIKEITL